MSTVASGLPKRRLGRTNLEVPALSLGGAGFGGVYGDVGDRDGVATVEYALAHGIHYIDTSPLYGERMQSLEGTHKAFLIRANEVCETLPCHPVKFVL